MKRRPMPPFELEVERLGPGGTGEGRAPDGRTARVRFAPPGARVAVVPTGRSKGLLLARRTAMVRPPAAWAVPPCPVFALCGGCALQEVALPAQRVAKAAFALAEVGLDAPTHPPRGVDRPYGYRNKLELSFGPQRYLSEADHGAGVPIDGRFLGLHAPGRFDRVVDLDRCWLAGDRMNAVVAATRGVALAPDAPAPWDPHAHQGFWRHLLLREAHATGQVLAVLYTGAHDAAWAERWADAVRELPGVVGVAWAVNAGVADVATGEVQRTWGAERLEERLGDVSFLLSAGSFFQTSTEGAQVLYDTVGEALGDAGGTLLDLYCGVGAIGLYLARRFDRIVGVEAVPDAVADARDNAARAGIGHAAFHVGKVEDALDVLAGVEGRRAIVVDPPRAGLHPKVVAALATAPADVLVYVACNPASLGRDAPGLIAGGWALRGLWTVDLFPQTGHVEVVARFTRPTGS